LFSFVMLLYLYLRPADFCILIYIHRIYFRDMPKACALPFCSFTSKENKKKIYLNGLAKIYSFFLRVKIVEFYKKKLRSIVVYPTNPAEKLYTSIHCPISSLALSCDVTLHKTPKFHAMYMYQPILSNIIYKGQKLPLNSVQYHTQRRSYLSNILPLFQIVYL
jgi:hypothetical protein